MLYPAIIVDKSSAAYTARFLLPGSSLTLRLAVSAGDYNNMNSGNQSGNASLIVFLFGMSDFLILSSLLSISL